MANLNKNKLNKRLIVIAVAGAFSTSSLVMAGISYTDGAYNYVNQLTAITDVTVTPYTVQPAPGINGGTGPTGNPGESSGSPGHTPVGVGAGFPNGGGVGPLDLTSSPINNIVSQDYPVTSSPSIFNHNIANSTSALGVSLGAVSSVTDTGVSGIPTVTLQRTATSTSIGGNGGNGGTGGTGGNANDNTNGNGGTGGTGGAGSLGQQILGAPLSVGTNIGNGFLNSLGAGLNILSNSSVDHSSIINTGTVTSNGLLIESTALTNVTAVSSASASTFATGGNGGAGGAGGAPGNNYTVALGPLTYAGGNGGTGGAGGAGGDAYAGDATAVSTTEVNVSTNGQVTNSQINNSGNVSSLSVNAYGIRVHASTDATGNAYATSLASSSSTYGNPGALDVGAGGVGGTGYFGSVSATASAVASVAANTTINSNTISNSGQISLTSSGSVGIAVDGSSIATSYANASVSTSQSGTNPGTTNHTTATNLISNAIATTILESNNITNTGSILADVGVRLLAIADVNSSGATSSSNNNVSSSTPTTSSSSYESDAWVQSSNNVTNSGAIVASVGNGIELRAEAGLSSSADVATAHVENNTITNNGIVSAGSDGILVKALATAVTSSNAYVQGNTINNTGSIFAMNNGVEITAFDSGTNNGTVTGNTINNNYGGRVVADNIGLYIHSESLAGNTVANNTINNSGLIVSDPGMTLSGTSLTKSNIANWIANNATAIQIAGDPPPLITNTLNLNAPAYLAGRILLDANSNTNVNLTSGVSQSVRWAFQHDTSGGVAYSQTNQASPYAWVGGLTTFAALSGPEPWFVNQQKTDVNAVVNDVYATIDPSGFAAAPNQLADLSNMVSNIAREGLTKNTEATDGFWLSAQGGVANYDGNNTSTMKQDNNLYTIALGYNRTVLEDYKVGLVAGYSEATFSTGSFYNDLYSHSFNNDAKGGYLGAIATTTMGPFDIDVGLSGGFQNHKDKRFVNDNLVWWGQSTANSSYNSYWFSPELGLSIPFQIAGGFTISPNVRLTYSGQHIDGYTESGTNSNATVDSQYIGVFEGKVGLKVANSFGPFDVSADVGYMGRSLTGDNQVLVTMIGDTHEVSYYYQDVHAVYVKAKASLNINKTVQAGVTASYTNGNNIEGGNVMGTVKINF